MAELAERTGVAVLGATGSVGRSALDVLARHPDRFRLRAVTAHSNAEALRDLCRRFRPDRAVLVEERAAARLADLLQAEGLTTQVMAGAAALDAVAALPDVDCVLAGIVGGAGLPSTLAAVRAGKRVLLANKESLIMAGPLLLDEARRSGACLLPIDSEHNGVFQCLPAAADGGTDIRHVRRIFLTASGGPFRDQPPEALADATPEQACAHPVWAMGRKISVDSATLMNKGLEVIEACRLFNLPPEQVGVVLHPQSLVHAMVEYRDGSVLAQMAHPDMRVPIAQALAWPERIESGVAPWDPLAMGSLDFEAPDLARFPCLALAYEALARGQAAIIALNAANEVAVAAFLDRRLDFNGIAEVVGTVLRTLPEASIPDLDAVFERDRQARAAAENLIDAQRWVAP